MSAITKPIHDRSDLDTEAVNTVFLHYVPAVERHASIQFRHLPEADREEQVAEAVASAFVNVRSAHQRGKINQLTPSTVAKYAVFHAKTGRHVGGPDDSTTDVLSRKAQTRHGFVCHSIHDRLKPGYDAMTDPTAPVWSLLLTEDKCEPVADLACFRYDWSEFLGHQHDRTRTAISMLAEGHRRCDVAERLGTTPSAVTQRMARAGREWDVFQGADGSS